MKWFAVVCVFVVMMGSAKAQTQAPAQAQAPAQTQTPPVAQAPELDEVSPGAALVFSLGGTLASYGAVVGGLRSGSGEVALAGVLGTLIMPSVGRWYAHTPGVGSLVIRAASAGTLLAGFVIGINDCVSFFGENHNTCNGAEVTTLILVGGLGFLGSTIYDIARAPMDARDYNAAHRARQVGLVPVVDPTQHHYGLAIAGRF